MNVDYLVWGGLNYNSTRLPEEVVLPLPSNIISAKTRSSFESLISIEMGLRKGQANDALEGLQIGLANKSLLLQTNIKLEHIY